MLNDLTSVIGLFFKIKSSNSLPFPKTKIRRTNYSYKLEEPERPERPKQPSAKLRASARVGRFLRNVGTPKR